MSANLPSVSVGDPNHAAIHNAERDAINAIQSKEIDYAESQTSSTAASTEHDAPGLMINFTLDAPASVIVSTGLHVLRSVAGLAIAKITLADNTLAMQATSLLYVANFGHWMQFQRRLSLGAGNHTYKVRVLAGAGGGTMMAIASAESPAFIRAVSVDVV